MVRHRGVGAGSARADRRHDPLHRRRRPARTHVPAHRRARHVHRADRAGVLRPGPNDEPCAARRRGRPGAGSPPMTTPPVTVEVDADGVAVVTVDHPPLNLYDQALHEALRDAVAELERRRPRAALFRAEGKVVSAGVDVKQVFHPMAQAGDVDGATRYFAELVDLGRRLHHLPFPTLFAAHGLTLTWAFEV